MRRGSAAPHRLIVSAHSRNRRSKARVLSNSVEERIARR
jgi:hypothetical protein